MSTENNKQSENKALRKTDVSGSVFYRELRIGNIIDCFGECEVIGITERKIKVRRKSQSETRFLIEKAPVYSDALKSILLTEEWLLKFGFNCDYNKIYTKEIDIAFALRFEKNEKIIILDVDINYEDTSLEFKHVKSVHQLQNLYFALTGSELQVVI